MHIQLVASLCLVLGLVLANLPFLFGPNKCSTVSRAAQGGTRMWLRLSSWGVMYVAWMLAAATLERAESMAVPWRWQLWAVSFAFFAVLSFPGLVWRYLRTV